MSRCVGRGPGAGYRWWADVILLDLRVNVAAASARPPVGDEPASSPAAAPAITPHTDAVNYPRALRLRGRVSVSMTGVSTPS